MLSRLAFKNVKTVKLQLYQLSEAGFIRYQEALNKTYRGHAPTEIQPKINDLAIQLLHMLKPIRQQQITLPFADDYLNHSTEFKMDALKAGIYILLLNDEATPDSALLQLANFRVSSLGYVNRRNADNTLELRVMDRETGKPVNHALVRLSKRDKSGQDSIYASGYSNSVGLFKPISMDNNSRIQLIYKKDTLVKNKTDYFGTTGSESISKRTILFTDRQIYRPGQTLYYKGLQIETFENKSKILTGEMVNVQLEDHNDQTIGEKQWKTNEFGTFSGSFTIPQHGITGELELSTDDGGLTLRVEEYKRPTFTLRFDTLKGTHHFNDSIRLTGKAITLSGYGLSNARVAYHVLRSRDDNSYYRVVTDHRLKYVPDIPTEILADTIHADNEGNFTLTFRALPADDHLAQKGLVYDFQINADVTDGSGETRSAITMVKVGKLDLSLYVSLPDRLTSQDTGKVDYRLNTLNGQKLKGTLTVTAYALEQPNRVFKNRLWNKPDLYLLSKNEYRQNFDFAYADEDDPKTWKQEQQVLNFQVPVTVGGEKNQIDLKPLLAEKSGLYKVVVLARTAQGDTISHSQFVEVFNRPSPPVSMNSWVIPLRTQINVGEQAEIRLGIGEPMHVLMEIYKNKAIQSSRWLSIKQQQNINIQIDGNDKDLSVQFLATYKNRQYTYYQNLHVNNPEKALHLRLLSFRNKLLPGEKEVWKMQVTGYKNEKVAAEMVAGLYDASLDQLIPGQYWNYWENDNR